MANYNEYQESDSFQLAHKFTAKAEGGISDHPADKGGYTAYGVSTAFLKDMRQSHPDLCGALSLMDGSVYSAVRRVRKSDAAALFHAAFWKPAHCGEMPPIIGCVLYDSCVNHGLSRGVKLMQQARNEDGPKNGSPLAVDGLIGPKTLGALMSLDTYNAKLVALDAIDLRRDFFRSIVRKNPSQKVFLNGWLNRANDLQIYVIKNYGG